MRAHLWGMGSGNIGGAGIESDCELKCACADA